VNQVAEANNELQDFNKSLEEVLYFYENKQSRIIKFLNKIATYKTMKFLDPFESQ